MMLFNLVKKDCLIIKQYLLLMLMIALIIPLFMYWRMPAFLGFCTLLISTIFVELMLTQSVSAVETKYPKASALLCSVPYPRRLLVKAKYGFTLIIFIFCCAAYSLEACLIPHLKQISVLDIAATFLMIAILYGIYSPLQYRYGYEKTKYFFVFTILLTPFILPAIIKRLPAFDLTGLRIPMSAICFILLTAGLIISLTSLKLSIIIYDKKEL